MKFNIDQFSPMQDTGTDKASEQPAYVRKLENCYVNSGNILPLKLNTEQMVSPDTGAAWNVSREIHTASSVVFDVNIGGTEYTLIRDKNTGAIEPAAPKIGGISVSGTSVPSAWDILSSNMLSTLDLSAFTQTSETCAPGKCVIRKTASGNICILYLVASGYSRLSTDGGNTFSSLAYKFIDAIANKDFSVVWAIAAAGLYKSTDCGMTWTLVTVTGYSTFVKLSWYVGTTSLFLQTGVPGGVVYNISTGATTAIAAGEAIENDSSGKKDGRSKGVIKKGSIFVAEGTTPVCLDSATYFSDEPDGANKFAYSEDRVTWIAEDGSTIKSTRGYILYYCRTYDVRCEVSGIGASMTYYIYKGDSLVKTLSGADDGLRNADGTSINGYVPNIELIKGVVNGGSHFVYCGCFTAIGNTADTLGTSAYPSPVKILIVKAIPLDGGTEIELGRPTMSMGFFGWTMYWLASDQYGTTPKLMTNPGSKYIGIEIGGYVTSTMADNSLSFTDVTSLTKCVVPFRYFALSELSVSNANFLDLGFSAVTLSNSFKTITLRSDNTIAGVRQSDSKICVMSLPEMTVSEKIQRLCPQIAPVHVYGSTIYQGPVLGKYYANIDGSTYTFYSPVSDQIKFLFGFVHLGGKDIPLATGSTQVSAIVDSGIITISGTAGIISFFKKNNSRRIEILTKDAGCHFGMFFDYSVSPGVGSVMWVDSEGLKKRDMMSGATTLVRVLPPGAWADTCGNAAVVVSTAVFTFGTGAAPGGSVYPITVIQNGATASVSDVPSGNYAIVDKRKMEYMCAIINPDTAEETLIFKDNNGILYKKDKHLFSTPLFTKEVFPGLSGALTYWPTLCESVNARFAMAGGFAAKGSVAGPIDVAANGDFTTSPTLTGWTASGATVETADVKLSKTGVSYLRQPVTETSIIVAEVNNPAAFDLNYPPVSGVTQSWVVMSYGSHYLLIYAHPTKDCFLKAKADNFFGDGIVYKLHAYQVERCDTSVYISGRGDYEDFTTGGAIQKMPSLGINFSGLIAVGSTLYVIQEGSTGRITETGDAANPFHVEEEFIRQGGEYPFKCLATFAVIRRARVGNIETGDIYLFSGSDYSKINVQWNSPYENPFAYGRVYGAETGGLTILSQLGKAVILGDEGRDLTIDTQKTVAKIGDLSLSGIVSGIIDEKVFITQTDTHAATVEFTGGQPNMRKRIKHVAILPNTGINRITVGGSMANPTLGAAGFNVTGERGINIVIDIDSDSYIEGMQVDADIIMPTARR